MQSTIAGIVLLLASMGPALAGVPVHIKKGDANSSAPQEVLYAQDGLLRMDELDDKGQVRSFVLIRDDAI